MEVDADVGSSLTHQPPAALRVHLRLDAHRRGDRPAQQNPVQDSGQESPHRDEAPQLLDQERKITAQSAENGDVVRSARGRTASWCR